ncbi:NUDIX domain-containing protein [Candidatus Pacearchaeota archaeon]|nr:NUDIX domain-containing protein [Candidatus Pacearchaeota archaeon]
MITQDTLQVIVFSIHQKEVKYLLLRRIPAKGGFWQPITGRKEKNESPKDGALRELQEELGIPIQKIIDVDNFPNGQGEGKDYIFAAEVLPSVEIRLDRPSVEHDHYQWCTYQEARTLLYWPQYTKALDRLKRMIK